MSDVAAPRRAAGGAFGIRAWLIAGAAASFVACLATLAYQPEITASQDLGPHALSRSPVGFAGLVTLLQADGVTVRMNRVTNPRPQDLDEALLVLTPPAVSGRELADLARGRRVLIIPPKWLTAPDVTQQHRLTKAGLIPEESVDGLLNAALPRSKGEPGTRIVTDPGSTIDTFASVDGAPAGRLAPVRLGPIESLRSFTPGRLTPIVSDRRGRAIAALAPQARAYVIADPDLLNNRSLVKLDRAVFAVNLIKAVADGRDVVFDLTLPHIAGQRNGLKLAFAPPFLPATLCALLLAALLGLTARERFGPMRRSGRAYGFGKRALADSAASLLAIAGREPRMAGRYLDLNRAAAVAAIGGPADGADETQDALLDQIGLDRGVGRWSEIAAEAQTTKTRGQLMALARRAYAWRMEMTRGRG